MGFLLGWIFWGVALAGKGTRTVANVWEGNSLLCPRPLKVSGKGRKCNSVYSYRSLFKSQHGKCGHYGQYMGNSETVDEGEIARKTFQYFTQKAQYSNPLDQE